MAMWASIEVADDGLKWLTSNANKICFCTTRPASKADATGASSDGGANIAISTELNFTGPAASTYTAGLRKVDISSTPTAVSVLSSDGGLGYIALITASTLAYATRVSTTRTVTKSDTVTMGAWRIDIHDPTTL